MRRIHQIFMGADQEQIRRATIQRGRKTLCWYPSASLDFRHIKMLEQEGLDNSAESPALIYIHTDVLLPEHWDIEADPSLLQYNRRFGPKLRIAKVTEIHPKKVISEICSDVCDGYHYRNIGRVFLLDVEMEILHRERLIIVPIPVIYFIAENCAFLVNALLHYRLRLETLIHIKDGGGSLGGSKNPMNFIYQAAPILKLKRVICDHSPEKKTFDTYSSFRILTDELRRSHYRDGHHLDAHYPMINVGEHLQKISGDSLRAAWSGRRIGHDQLCPNWAEPPDGSYYDWRPRQNPKPNPDATVHL